MTLTDKDLYGGLIRLHILHHAGEEAIFGLGIMEELRGTSQLLVITHQKRTMDIADALYGVTMRDGVSQVISQRMRELV